MMHRVKRNEWILGGFGFEYLCVPYTYAIRMLVLMCVHMYSRHQVARGRSTTRLPLFGPVRMYQ